MDFAIPFHRGKNPIMLKHVWGNEWHSTVKCEIQNKYVIAWTPVIVYLYLCYVYKTHWEGVGKRMGRWGTVWKRSTRLSDTCFVLDLHK